AIGWPVAEKGKEVAKTEFDAWITIQRSHAIANGVFVAAVNRTGLEENLDFWGGSFVADPFGKILQQASHDREEIILVDCDLSRIEEVRESWPFLDCRRMKIAEPK
ncbi:MAG: acyltransferase, partial [Deltaproteobacteria bacterium]|nr:acyltransferase [Deltaproteobacteria bacterium]